MVDMADPGPRRDVDNRRRWGLGLRAGAPEGGEAGRIVDRMCWLRPDRYSEMRPRTRAWPHLLCPPEQRVRFPRSLKVKLHDKRRVSKPEEPRAPQVLNLQVFKLDE